MMSSEPTRPSLPKDWQYADLHKRVREAIFALPSRTTVAFKALKPCPHYLAVRFACLIS